MKELIIKNQIEFDNISNDFSGCIYFENGNNLIIVNGRFPNARLEAWGNSSVVAWDNSSVVARDNSSVEARDNSSVEAWDNSSVVARDNSYVVARDNSSVEARDNSYVVARDNSSVDLCGFSQARIMSSFVDYKTANKARVILPFETIEDFAEYYGIDIVNGKVKMYKAVHTYSGKYTSDYCDSFCYKIGETTKEPNIDTDTYDDCGAGLHISTLKFALGFGDNWRDLAILEVEANIKDIVVPKFSGGKIRTSKLKVLREVPLEEGGVYGKILAKRRER